MHASIEHLTGLAIQLARLTTAQRATVQALADTLTGTNWGGPKAKSEPKAKPKSEPKSEPRRKAKRRKDYHPRKNAAYGAAVAAARNSVGVTQRFVEDAIGGGHGWLGPVEKGRWTLKNEDYIKGIERELGVKQADYL